MLDNKINYEMKAGELAEILVMISEVLKKLPFLVELSPEEKQLLPRLGDKTQKFVEKTYELAKQKTDFLPRGFSVEEMGKDLKLNTDLFAILTALNLLTRKVEDSYIETGSELYNAALIIYGAAKNSRISEGLEEMVTEIGARFSRKTKKSLTEHKP